MTDHNTQNMPKASGIVPQLVENELRILDTDLAERLGFSKPLKIREFIQRHRITLEQLGVLPTVGKTSGTKGGRPTQEYYLNKKQAIFITAKSETAEATEITIEVIERFDAYESGKITIKAPRKRRPPMDVAFRQFKNIASLLGLDDNQQAIAADRGTRQLTGNSPLQAMGMTSFIASTNDNYLLPTQIGKEIGGLSAIKVNKLLSEKGLQTRSPGSVCAWSLTEKGQHYGRMFDGVRKNGTGAAVTLKWKPEVIGILQGKGNAA